MGTDDVHLVNCPIWGWDNSLLVVAFEAWNFEASLDFAHVTYGAAKDWPYIAFVAWHFEALRKYNCISFDPAPKSFYWRLEWFHGKGQALPEVEFEAWILKLLDHIIVNALIPLMELVEVRANFVNCLGYLP